MESGLFMHDVYVHPIPNAMKRVYSVWSNYQTHMRVRNWLKTL